MSFQGTSFIVDTPLFQGTALESTSLESTSLESTSLESTSLESTSLESTSLEQAYIASLDEIDKIALNVARTTMGSLFSLSKSTAFIEWTNERNKKQLDA